MLTFPNYETDFVNRQFVIIELQIAKLPFFGSFGNVGGRFDFVQNS